MKLFLENKYRVMSREEIMVNVWLKKDCVVDRAVDVNVMRLRRKMRNYGKNITTRLSYGYSFEE